MQNIIPRITSLVEKKIVGLHQRMSLANNKTPLIWKSFMPRRDELRNRCNSDLISMAIYDPAYFENFSPAREFEKWATVEVSDFSFVPEGMDTFVIKAGQYAVFHYKGLNTDYRIYQHIFSTWLPGSDYLLDDRPHFEVMGEKYRNNDPASEEEIWIPVKTK
jgi:AraC family transcriptional regulator